MKSPLSSLNTPLSPMSTPKIPRHCLPTTLHCKLSLLMKTPSHNPKACHFISKILLPIHPVFMQLPTKNFRSLQKCEMKFLTWILYRKARRGRKRNSWPSQSRKIDRRIQRMQTWWKEQGSQPYQVMYCWCQPTWQRLGIRWRKKGFMAWEERVNLQRKRSRTVMPRNRLPRESHQRKISSKSIKKLQVGNDQHHDSHLCYTLVSTPLWPSPGSATSHSFYILPPKIYIPFHGLSR